MNKYYEGIEVDFTVYGILPQHQVEEFEREFMRTVETINPLTKEIYADMTPAQKKAVGTGLKAWQVQYGLNLFQILL